MKSTIAVIPALVAGALAAPNGPPSYGSHNSAFGLKTFSSLVIFGDSYSDDSRLGYFISSGGSPPPVGWVDPVSYHAADGGRIWGEYVKQYTGVNLYNYAVSGAVCSNDITPRYFSAIKAPFPAVAQYEVPAYIADSHYVNQTTGKKFMYNPSDATVYAIWIGTNDLGNYAFITDSEVAGATLANYTDCVFSELKKVYDNGGRYFVINNNAPLNLAPQYGLPGHGGLNATQYWPDKSGNLTEISEKMRQYVAATNDIYKYETPFQVKVANMFPGAHFALYNVNGLMTDIYNNPSEYLNGTAPLNVTGYINHCTTSGTNCTANKNPDSFMWYDELHPSEQTERIVAKNFVNVVKGTSKWASYWSS